jgi:serine/threonine-protein kinase RsbW
VGRSPEKPAADGWEQIVHRHTPKSGLDSGETTDADHTGTTVPEGPAETGAVPASTPTSAFEELAPALPNEVAELRRKLTRWLGELPLDPESTHDITLATYEALANVAAHAYPDGHGWARLQATREGDAVTVTVTDTGCGIPATRSLKAGPRTSGGRGLLLIDKVTDQSDVDTGAHGTRVSMTWRPAALRG